MVACTGAGAARAADRRPSLDRSDEDAEGLEREGEGAVGGGARWTVGGFERLHIAMTARLWYTVYLLGSLRFFQKKVHKVREELNDSIPVESRR